MNQFGRRLENPDIIRTVAVTPLASMAVFAGAVIIRTFLSFSSEVVLEGRFPGAAMSAWIVAKSGRPSDGDRRAHAPQVAERQLGS